jgi:hypothetical protein
MTASLPQRTRRSADGFSLPLASIAIILVIGTIPVGAEQ